MAASFLKRKLKEPDGPQRREIPVLEADAETGLSAAQAQERLCMVDAEARMHF